jgi:hypothetical protein
MLPNRIHTPNRDALPVRTHRYQGLDDLRAVVEAEKPAVVFLCSGYLLSTHGTLSLEALRQFVRELGESGCRVVTTDPFLGLVSRPDFASLVDFTFPEGGIDAWSWKFLKQAEEERLTRNLTDSFEILKPFPHLYPVFPGGPGRDDTENDLLKISFHNPELVSSAVNSLADPIGEEGRDAGERPPYWAFVLALCDYDILSTLLGRDVFLDYTLAYLRAAQAAGKKAVFIGPKECVQALRHRVGENPAIELLMFCSYKQFMALLFHAEFAFYWNSVSHSILIRLLNCLPVFLFDRGHLARNLKAIYPRIVEWYYQGWEPIYLNPRVPLHSDELCGLADEFRSAATEISQHLRRSPTPADLVRNLCGATACP